MSEKNDISSESCNNVGSLLTHTAQRVPAAVAVAHDRGKRGDKAVYDTITFAELEAASNRIALGLQRMGVKSGMRLALLVPPSVNFVACVFGLFKSGATIILIDPGMGRRNMIGCLGDARPDGFVAIPAAQAVRRLLRKRFPQAKYNVTVGGRWYWPGPKLEDFAKLDAGQFSGPTTVASDPAAIIFTTGSTGPPKGVLYTHGNFIEQARQIRDFYGIEPGGADLSAFPLFALFNSAMGKATIIPDMDATRPADADPRKIIRAINDWQADQSFGSPALWNTVGRYCEQHRITLPTIKRILSAGAPVPVHVLQRLKQIISPDGDIFTPYGATEALPVASNSASVVLNETGELSQQGAGTCVGNRFAGIQWRVIRIDDGPIPTIDEAEELPQGEIGELMVTGPVITKQYVTRVEANALHKVADGDSVWHRMGDVGYLDARDRFWFCGRKAHRVQTADGTLFTIPCEAIINNHSHVYRSALVGVGRPGVQLPVIVVETWPEYFPKSKTAKTRLLSELKDIAAGNKLTHSISHFLIHKSLPVDIRHNSKIFREKLGQWASKKLA